MENMAEERKWDQICTKAEKLRAANEKKWTWGKIAEQFGVEEGNLYYYISRRREAKNIPRKRVGALEVLLATHLLSGTVQDLNDVRSG